MSREPIFLELHKFVNPRDNITKISSKDVVSCRQTHMVQSVLDVMLNSGVSKMPVTTKQGKIVGMVSALDILDFIGGGPKYKTFVLNKRKTDQQVKNIMTKGIEIQNGVYTIARALENFKRHRRGSSPVIHREKFKGMLHEIDFATQIDRPLGIDVEEMMIKTPIVAKEKFTIEEVSKMMCRGGFKTLPVTQDNVYLGMVTPIDILSYLNKNRMMYRLRKVNRKVTRAMDRNAPTIKPGADIYEALLLMKHNKTTAIPVVEDHDLMGIITARDIVDALV
jgi:CBS domain-containing protein